ncbi:MAG: CCA tRNA nucleotidyltransferase [Bacillota bacterium]
MKDRPFIDTLIELNKYFNKPIYIVGGAVRNYILGYRIEDIDLAAAISPEQMINNLSNSGFRVSLTSPKLFTLKIQKDDFSFEFTSFRKDTYTGGKHRPDTSSMTADILEDAKRRDFTINSIYYDISKDSFNDPLRGIEDLRKGIIKTVDNPERVFSQDGLRLMRLIRQAAELAMEIEPEVFEAAKKYSYLLRDIAIERIREEFDKIIIADTKYIKPNAHVRGFLLLDEAKLLEYFLPEIKKGKGVTQRKDFHKYDVYNHILKCFEYSRPDIRLAALFHDIAKPFCINEDGSMKGHDRKGKEMAQNILNRMKYPKKTISQVKRLVNYHMYDLSGKAKDSTIRKFIQDNFDILDKLIALKNADHKAGGVVGGESESATRLKRVYEKMKEDKIPFTIKDLQVDGKDLIELDVPNNKRSLALQSLLQATIYGGEMLKRKNQLRYLKENKNNF